MEPRRQFAHFGEWMRYCRSQGMQVKVMWEWQDEHGEEFTGSVKQAYAKRDGYTYGQFSFDPSRPDTEMVKAYGFSREYMDKQRQEEMER